MQWINKYAKEPALELNQQNLMTHPKPHPTGSQPPGLLPPSPGTLAEAKTEETGRDGEQGLMKNGWLCPVQNNPMAQP